MKIIIYVNDASPSTINEIQQIVENTTGLRANVRVDHERTGIGYADNQLPRIH